MSFKKGIAFSAVLFLLLAAACGGGETGQTSRPSTPAPSAGGTATPAAGGGAAAAGDWGTSAITGAVQFEGEAPGGKKIRMDADPFCSKSHPDGDTTEEVVVNDNGTLRNVFIYVKSGLEGKSYDVPAEPIKLDQNGCRYKPHVQGMMAGQGIKILNSDDTLHNIHAQPSVNKAFNVAMPKYLKEREEMFSEPEIMVPIKCDVHSWMATYVGVVAHPFFSVTDKDGSFDLSKLPAGTYTVEAWHEKYGTQTQEVTVGDGESQEISFTFSAS
jgi:hypothetical protein